MSEFPVPGSRVVSGSRSRLNRTGIESPFGIVAAKEKGACVYDVDGNKYADFHLHSGTVIVGHNPPVVTRKVKDALSGGMAPGIPSKLLTRPAARLLPLTDFPSLAFFSSGSAAFSRLLSRYLPEKICVNTLWLKSRIETWFPHLRADLPPLDGEYDLAFLEPAEMDGDLSDTRFADYHAEIRVSVEDRTAFRMGRAFLASSAAADHLLSCANIACGMDFAVLFSRAGFPGDPVAAYQAAAVNESLTALLRPERPRDTLDFGHPLAAARRGSVIRLSVDLQPERMADFGIIASGRHLYFCDSHTEFDVRRLQKALDNAVRS